MGLAQKIVPEEEKLHAFDNDIKKSIEYIHLNVQIADTSVLQKFKVVKCQGSMTIVLGRDFLFKHYSTEFDWLNGQVHLGRKWLKPKVWIRDGSFQDRVSVVNSEKQEVVFDINPNLTSQQKSKLLTLLNEYSDCFASNPKKPFCNYFGGTCYGHYFWYTTCESKALPYFITTRGGN